MRRLVLVSSLLLALGALLFAALPWWFGAALRSVSASTGLTFAEYQRIGYKRFVLVGAHWQRKSVTVTADRLEGTSPLLWLMGDRTPVEVDGWSVEVAPALPAEEATRVAGEAVADEPKQPHGVVRVLARVREALLRIDPWMPPVTAGRGELRLAAARLRLDSIEYRPGELDVAGLHWRRWSADAKVSWKGEVDWIVGVGNVADGWRAEASGEGPNWVGSLHFHGQEATAEAEFAPEGWLPGTAVVRAADWTLPGETLRLGNAYENLRGEFRADWRDRRLEYAVRFEGVPASTESSVPALHVDLRGGGAWNDFLVEAAHVQMPGLNATLSAPLRIRPAALGEVGASTFAVEADLAAWPELSTSGRLSGEATVSARSDGWPAVAFSLQASGVVFRGAPSLSGMLEGELLWPTLRIGQVRGALAGGSAFDGGGEWHFVEHRLTDGRLKVAVAGADLRPHLPDGFAIDSADLEATADGVWPEWIHAGGASWQPASVPGLKPFSGRLQWKGQGATLPDITATVSAEGSQVDLGASLDSTRLRLGKFDWAGEDQPSLALRHPAEIAWMDGLRLSEFALAGGGTSVALDGVWRARGEARVTVANLSSAWLRPWVKLSGPDWRVKTLSWAGAWPEGTLVHKGSAGVELALGETRTAEVEIALSGDAQGHVVDRLAVSEKGAPIVQAEGRIPLVVWPAGEEHLRVLPDGRLEVKARSEPNAAFWEQLAEITGVRFEAPRLEAELGGTWTDPRGFLDLSSGRVTLQGARWPDNLPGLGGLRLRIAGDGRQLALEELVLEVAGQALRAEGTLPVTSDTWSALREHPLDHLRREAEGRIEIPDAEMAAFARMVPSYLAPSGRFQASLALRRGGDWDGFIRLHGAASRPLGPLGVLQEVRADLRLVNRTVQFREVSARVGGQPVVLAGEAELPLDGGPRLALTLKGENLPFVRQTGLLLRGDLDLRAQTDVAGVTRLTGQARLRDSLFLADLLSLLPGSGGASAPTDRRPPYFSVGVAPIDAWVLDVEVHGERFLRLRTPVFAGEASAHFRLSGTLGSPRAIGEATIDSGNVLLPFANFRVTQGRVRLSEADPYTPMLSLSGTGRRFGYDLRLDLDGSAAAPALRFSSSPPLGSEEVLLMVMAGEPPNDEIAYTGRQRFVRLGTYLGQSLFRGLGGDAGSAERFSLTTGERVSRQGRETYGFSYELDSRWSLVGEYDEFDDYNVGLKWRILSGQGEGNHER